MFFIWRWFGLWLFPLQQSNYYMIRTSYSINMHYGYVYQGVVRVQRSSLLNLDLDTRMYARRFSWRTGDVPEAQNCNLKKHFNMFCPLHLMWISLDLNVCRFRWGQPSLCQRWDNRHSQNNGLGEPLPGFDFCQKNLFPWTISPSWNFWQLININTKLSK